MQLELPLIIDTSDPRQLKLPIDSGELSFNAFAQLCSKLN